ncbi:hypothetical protein EV368DRAFT_39563, partial [Lentinula lateritia]
VSPDDSSLKAFYEDMEKRERLERKASSAKRKSQGHLFSRKSVKRSSKTAATSPAPEPGPSLNPTTTITASKLVGKQPEQKQDAGEMETLEQNEKNDSVTSLPTTSIIPDPLKELPTWYSKEDWSSTPSFKVRYPIHNPVGPRYYRNHHLIPPSVYRPGARPPSIFSPSFPAMGTSSMPERLDDATRLPVPSRTPSHSPLPTPSSSQTRVADLGIKPRSRKTSQSAHDNVDLLDVSDPWGTNWHHESPYDIGLASSGPIAADVDLTRSRRSSITTPARRKTVTPSPLSQSTSAIHLQAPLTEGSHMPRKLSKRRGLSGIFGSYGKTTSHSLPTSPVADLLSQPHPPRDEKSKRASTMPSVPPSSHTPISAIKKDRRGSIIGRLTKRFSVTRKQSNTVAHEGLPHTEDQSQSTEMRLAFKKSSEKLSKRVPPPSLDNIEVDEITLKAIHDPDRRSSISVEASFPAKGKLMVANPDAPSSEMSTPPQVDAPLPVHQANTSDSQPWRSADKRSSSGPRPSQHAPLDPSLSAVSYSPPSPAPAHNPASTSFSSSPLNGHMSTSDSANAIKSPRHGSASAGYSQRQSLADNISHIPSERVISPFPSNHRRSAEYRRPRSPERGPPPPSSTTKPDEYLTHRVSHLSVSRTIVEDSPLSAASMLVNPPTPQINDELAIPTEPTASSVPRRTSSRDPSPGISSVTTRETETFKLVRTQSGNVQTACEIIPAAGEQWEVVEEVAHTRRSSKSKDQDRLDRDHTDTREKDRDARKESRRQEKKSTEVNAEGSDRRGKPSSRSSRQHSVDNVPQTQKTYSNKAVARSSSMESRSPAPASMRAQEETRSGRTRDGQRSNRKISGSHSASPTKPSSSSSTRPLERAPSKSARPTSELPSAADLNALRAREAWEMERLYKGHSMYGMEPNNEAVAPPMAMSASSVPTGSNFPSTTSKTNGASHGSSHTSFVVQNFASQGSATHIYHSMPAQPPPIIYAPSSLPAGHVAPASIASSPPRASSSSSAPSPPRASPSTTTTPSDLLSFIRPPNPLPEPPRETLTPSLARISQTFTDNSNTPKTERPSEYWTTFAEVSAAR